MGSTVLAYHSMVRLKQQMGPDTEFYFLIFKSNRESVELLNFIPPPNILTIESSNFLRFTLTTFTTLLRLRLLRIDTSIDLELYSRFTAILGWLSGARNRVGYHNFTEEGLYRGGLITHPVLYNPFLHMTQNYLALVDALLAKDSSAPHVKAPPQPLPTNLPSFFVSEERSRKMLERVQEVLPEFQPTRGDKLVLLNPDPGQLPLRGWSVESYSALVKESLSRRDDVYFLICGVSDGKPFADRLVTSLPQARVRSFVGITSSLSELLDLFTLSSCLVK
ncbi:MAG: hypothetical protein KDD55_12540, partial [Bdellovibrionales bacterium]|nr:hypothetical protein [Bdellovibrionales bacterium]